MHFSTTMRVNDPMVLALVVCLMATAGRSLANEPLGLTPEVFSPGTISGPAHDSAPAFTPTGETVYFGRSNPQQSMILVSRRAADGSWTRPEIAPFSGIWNDMEPAMSPDGGYMVFVSNRPDPGDSRPVIGFYGGKAQKGGRLWRIDRPERRESQPYLLSARVNAGGSIYAPSVARDGSIYFMTTDVKSGKFRLFRSQYDEGDYRKPAALPFSDGTFTDVDPAVAPDESFVIFGSSRKIGRGIDLFIVFKESGVWGQPIHLGDDINTSLSDAEPRLSPDGLHLYFSSERTTTIQFPRSPTQAREDAARMQAWDDGNYNIWTVSLPEAIDRVHVHR